MLGLFVSLTLVAAIAAQSQTPLLALGDNRGNQVWSDLGSIARYEIGVHEANIPSAKWNVLAHYAQSDWNKIKKTIHAFQDRSPNKDALANATSFTQIWNSDGDSTWTKGTFWRIECPAGFVALGDVVVASGDAVPQELKNKVRCVNAALAEDCKSWGVKLWDNDNSFARKDASAWVPEAGKEAYTEWFTVNTKHNERPSLTPKCLKKSSFEII